MKFQSNKLLTQRKDYMYDGSNGLYKQINSVKLEGKINNISYNVHNFGFRNNICNIL